MTIANALAGIHSVFLDTAPVIYYIEDHDRFGPIMRTIVDFIQSGKLKAFSSVVTMAEVMPKPIEAGNEFLADKFSAFLRNAKNLTLIDINDAIAEAAGRMRGRNPGLRTMDAIQIAASLNIHADAFITNDVKLKNTPAPRVIVLKDYVVS